ncbi:unnamed protein product [Orchesella dallaii]|uniref:TATA box-binding protein-like 1 n=1 Tax=Orchesella dallaii TaxID=48710 RepID=A0ABP1QEJ5_9HEXA
MSTVATISVAGPEANGNGMSVIGSDHKENLQLAKSTAETSDLIQQNGTSVEPKVEEKGENEIDIILNNVVCNFSVRCHLNLKQIAMNGHNVEFHREMAMLIMKFRRPSCTASIWSTGKITMTGATTETDAKTGARRCARTLQKLGFNVRFTNYRIVNVLATCTMPFAIKIADFAQAYPRLASYEPELHPGVTYKMKDIKATLKVFSTGSITITAPCVDNVQLAVEHIYNLVFEFKRERQVDDLQQYPISERKKRRREKRLLREQLANGSSKVHKGPSRKKTKYDEEFINDEERELVDEDEEDEELSIVEFKTPIEIDESEEEDAEEFDSDISHD